MPMLPRGMRLGAAFGGVPGSPESLHLGHLITSPPNSFPEAFGEGAPRNDVVRVFTVAAAQLTEVIIHNVFVHEVGLALYPVLHQQPCDTLGGAKLFQTKEKKGDF